MASSAPHSAMVEVHSGVMPLAAQNKCNLVNLVPPAPLWKGGERKWRVQNQGEHEPEHLPLLSTREPFVPWLAHFISQLSCVCPYTGNWVVFFLNLLRADTEFCPTTLCQQHHHNSFLEALTQKLATFLSNRMEESRAGNYLALSVC